LTNPVFDIDRWSEPYQALVIEYGATSVYETGLKENGIPPNWYGVTLREYKRIAKCFEKIITKTN
jgi:hypothetical protein